MMRYRPFPLRDLRPPPLGWWWLAVLALASALLYYPVGMALVHRIDDDPAFRPAAAEGGSRAAAMAAGLILREVDTNRWTANDPFFQPSSALDDMPAFQQGIVAAVASFTFEMNARLGRARGSTGLDPDLDRAAGLLKYPGNVWMFDPSTSWAPTASSEKQYRSAARAMQNYNARLAAGQAVFERHPEALQGALERIAADLGQLAAAHGGQVDAAGWGPFDPDADEAYFEAKGRLYAYALLLGELGADFQAVLGERNLGGAWRRMQESAAAGAALSPLVVINADADSLLLPSHLAAQGFHVLRLRAELLGVAEALGR